MSQENAMREIMFQEHWFAGKIYIYNCLRAAWKQSMLPICAYVGDDRHVGIKKLVSRRASKRFFSNWSMLHDPAISLIWNQQQIRDGILDRIPQSEIIGMFEAISHRSDLHDFDH
jgi:hypothetical protein